jgi:hypothetical protein
MLFFLNKSTFKKGAFYLLFKALLQIDVWRFSFRCVQLISQGVGAIHEHRYQLQVKVMSRKELKFLANSKSHLKDD